MSENENRAGAADRASAPVYDNTDVPDDVLKDANRTTPEVDRGACPEGEPVALDAEPKAEAPKSDSAKAASVSGGKSCDEVKSSIEEKVRAKGNKSYTLEVVAAADVKDQKVVGSCAGGSKKIVKAK